MGPAPPAATAAAIAEGAAGLSSRTLLIGCGFIGSHVALEFAASGAAPLVLTRSRPGERVVAAIGEENLRLGDAAEPATVEAALEGAGRVVFCAGGLLPAAAEREPERDRELTLGPLRTVLAALRRHPGTTLLYVSSGGTVYGEPERLPVREDDPTEPLSAYGRLRLECEREIRREREQHGLRAWVLRCATVYGEYQRPGRGQGAIATFLPRIERGEQIDLYGGAEELRDYVYAGDVAAALVALATHPDPPATVNVGSGSGTSLPELVAAIVAAVGRPAVVAEHPPRSFDVHRIVLDTSRLQELTGFEPTPLEAGIARTREWLNGLEEAS